jgi:hypothetical protein
MFVIHRSREGAAVNFKTLFASAAGLAAMLATTGAAFADTSMASDQNLRFTRAYVERGYDMLSHDQADYGGHRVAAMSDINNARNDLTAALRYDRAPDDAVIPTGTRPGDTDIANFERNQSASNKNIEFVRTLVERSIDMLQHDAHDYGGYRLKAIAALQAAHEQLADAIAYRDAHRGMPQPASDQNLRYTRLYVNRAIDMLQHDQRDYSGHRAAAVTDLQRAQADLMSALRYDANKEDAVLPTHALSGDEDLDAFFMRGQFASDLNIAYVRRYVERSIDMLQHDAHDYNGFRVKAIADLQAARAQLLLALQSRP